MRLVLTLTACLFALATVAGDSDAQLLPRRLAITVTSPACPVMGPGCVCGCEQTGLCSCFGPRPCDAQSTPAVNSPCPNGVCTPAERVADAKAPAPAPPVIGYRQVCDGVSCKLVPITQTAAPPVAFYPLGSPTVVATPEGPCVARVRFMERGPVRRFLSRR